MKIGKCAWVLLPTAVLVGSLAVGLAGCGDFWQAPNGTSTTTTSTSTTTLSSGVFYVLNSETDQLVAFSIASGQLTTIGSYTPPSSLPTAIAVAPNGLFLYVSTGGGIYLYDIDSDGALTLGNGSTYISPDLAQTMQVDATNSWLVDGVLGSINAIAINPSTGVLAAAGEKEQSFTLPATTLAQLVISPNDSSSCDDCYVFVAMGTGGTEEVHFDPGSANPFGSAGHFNVLNSLGADNAVAVDPTNRLLYVGESDALPSETQSGGLRVFTIASNAITELTTAGSPYSSGGTGPSAILAQSGGDYVYIANEAVSGSSTGNIQSFSVTPTALTSIGTVATGYTPLSLAADSMGNFLLVVDSGGSPDLEAYTMASGTLTSVLTAPTGADPVGASAITTAP